MPEKFIVSKECCFMKKKLKVFLAVLMSAVMIASLSSCSVFGNRSYRYSNNTGYYDSEYTRGDFYDADGNYYPGGYYDRYGNFYPDDYYDERYDDYVGYFDSYGYYHDNY